MSEMAVSADQIIVIGRGKFITQGSVDDLTANATGTVLVRSSDNAKLTSLIGGLNGTVHHEHDHQLTVSSLTCDEIGQAAFAAGITVLELTPQRASLEDVFMELTAGAVEFGGGQIETIRHE
jgi:ABC-2 type transport system ATP-binding protein